MNKFLSVGLMSLGLLAGSSAVAQAAEVSCENEFGSCRVSNDGYEWMSCECEDGPSGGGTGGDEWAGYSGAQLLEICESELEWCETIGQPSGGGSETGDPGTSTTSPGSATSTSSGDPTDGTDPATTGEDPTEGTDTTTTGAAETGGEEDGSGAAEEDGTNDDDGDGSIGDPEKIDLSCTVGGGSAPTFVGLGLLALVGFGQRRRRSTQ